jgi:hypothetical protein
MILNSFVIKNTNIYIYIKVYPGFGPAQHDPLNGDWAMPRLRLRPGGPARHNPFLFCVVSGLISEGTSPTELGPGRASTARWLDIVLPNILCGPV